MDKTVLLSFQRPGLQTLIMDQGRLGPQELGIPIGGAMDKLSARLVNELVGNPPSSPVFEITLMGPKILITGNCQIALCGAHLSPLLNNRPIPMNETINVESGSHISFGKPLRGCRTYLAVGGEWKVPSWHGSYSAFAQAGMELPKGSVIRKGTEIRIAPTPWIQIRNLALSQRPNFPECLTVGMMPGPEFDSFGAYTIGHFLSREHIVSNQSNRMGYRLESQLANYQAQAEVISSGVVPGTIQITHSGQPIILMADAQTTGGYLRMGNVVSKDMDQLGQLKPGDRLRFELL
ncbi:MAG: biotin-dependent carboxyltransferase family protein [Bacteroidota bacterium]